MMGAGNVKRVYARWGDLQGPAFRLLTYIALTVLDRDARPRCELSRESLAGGLGYETLDAKADRAVTRALASLTVAGALTRAQRAAPGQRAHYWLELSMEHLPPGVQRSNDDGESNVGQSASEHLPPNVQRSEHDTVLLFSGEVPGEELTAAATPPPPHLHAIPGGNGMPRTTKPQQPGLWPAPVPNTPGDALSVTTAQTIVGEWIDRCAKRPPGRVIGQVAKYVREMLAEDIDPDDIRRGTAAWMVKGLHPAALPSVVNEVMNRGPAAAARPSTTDQRVADAVERGRRLQALHDQQAVGS